MLNKAMNMTKFNIINALCPPCTIATWWSGGGSTNIVVIVGAACHNDSDFYQATATNLVVSPFIITLCGLKWALREIGIIVRLLQRIYAISKEIVEI